MEEQMGSDFESRVFSVFKAVLDVQQDSGAGLIYNESEGWDSLAHMSIIAGLESAFDCMLEMDDILDMSSFEQALIIMKKYG